jgi:hypothetical protein
MRHTVACATPMHTSRPDAYAARNTQAVRLSHSDAHGLVVRASASPWTLHEANSVNNVDASMW